MMNLSHPAFSPNALPKVARTSRAFSLIELLTVIAIFALLGSLLVPALGTGGGRLLATEGARLSSLFDFARQNAQTKNAVTALVMINDPASVGNLRAFSIWELSRPADGSLPSPADWRQVNRWEAFPNGVVVNPNALGPVIPQSDLSVPLPTSSLRFGGQPVSDVRSWIFLPGGQVLGGNQKISLAEGTVGPQNGDVQLKRMDGQQSQNRFDLVLIGASGRIKLDRD